MKTEFVPQDIFMKHEGEWRALRLAAGRRIDVGRVEISREVPFTAPAAKPDIKPDIKPDMRQRL
jgi:hypothetical protein